MKLNKITLALLVGIVALNVATVSMSIAWYSRSASVYIDAIDIVFDGERDLKIATKIDGDYVDHLNYSDLDRASLFAPVTSAHSTQWMKNKKKTPEFYDDSKNYGFTDLDEDIEAVTDGYYSQSLYLMSDDDIYVTIDPDKTHFLPNEEYNKNYAKQLYQEIQQGVNEELKIYTEEQIFERLNELINAMRFSILLPDEEIYSYVVIDPTYQQETYLGGVLDNDIDHYYDYYRGSDMKLYERVYGEIIGNRSDIVYDEADDIDSSYLDPSVEGNAFNARHKAGVKKFNKDKSIANGVQIKTEESLTLEDFALGNVKYHFPVYRDTPREVVVSIYIEGWDLESVNYTMGATFLASLGFKIEREM